MIDRRELPHVKDSLTTEEQLEKIYGKPARSLSPEEEQLRERVAENQICRDCAYWRNSNSFAKHDCVRFPPVNGEYNKVEANETCGEFKREAA